MDALRALLSSPSSLEDTLIDVVNFTETIVSTQTSTKPNEPNRSFYIENILAMPERKTQIISPSISSSTTSSSNKRKYATLTPMQKYVLKEQFRITQYPHKSIKEKLAELLNLPQTRIEWWFQYKRSSYKREYKSK